MVILDCRRLFQVNLFQPLDHGQVGLPLCYAGRIRSGLMSALADAPLRLRRRRRGLFQLASPIIVLRLVQGQLDLALDDRLPRAQVAPDIADAAGDGEEYAASTTRPNRLAVTSARMFRRVNLRTL